MGTATRQMEVGVGGSLRLPDDLTELEQWVPWLYEIRGDSKTKVPYQTNGKRADSTDPTTWTTFETALRYWQRFPRHYAGIGFVFHVEDSFCGGDLDNCLDQAGVLKPWAQGLVARFSDTYMEVSPSGRGIKFWCRGKLPANMGKVTLGDGGIEMYDHFRFFTVTGKVFNGAPIQIEDHAADILTLYEKMRQGRPRGWQQEIDPGGRIPHGKQHLTLVSLAGTMWRRGMCAEAIEVALLVVNEKQCERPGDPAHIRQIVNSIRNWRRA